jgi:hypothetical protein
MRAHPAKERAPTLPGKHPLSEQTRWLQGAQAEARHVQRDQRMGELKFRPQRTQNPLRQRLPVFHERCEEVSPCGAV